MLILASTSDKLRLVTASAGDIQVHASWLDNVAGAVQPGRTNTAAITTATTTDIVGSPASGVFRNIKTLAIHNHGTTPNAVTVLHTDGATPVELHRAMLGPQETLQYIDEIGFRQMTAGGQDAMGPRVLLKRIDIAPSTSQIIIGPGVFDAGFDIYEFDLLGKTAAGTTNLALMALLSVDGGVTYPSNAAGYHYNSILSSSGNTAGWNTIQGSTSSAGEGFYPLNVMGDPFYQGRGNFRLYQGDGGGSGMSPGVAVVRGYTVGFVYASTLHQGTVEFTAGPWGTTGGGKVTHMKMDVVPAGNSMLGGYIKCYGLR